MKKIIGLIISTIMILLYSGCCNESNIGTIKADDYPQGWWRPPADSLVMIYEDSVGNKLKFECSGGLEVVSKNEVGGYGYSCGTYSAIFEYQRMLFHEESSMYSIIYSLEPNWSDEPTMDVDEVRITLNELTIANDDINEIHEEVTMEGHVAELDSVTLNGITFIDLFSMNRLNTSKVYFKKHVGIVGFKHLGHLWVLK